MADGRIYCGLNGRVIAVARTDGSVLWSTALASSQFVTVVSDVEAVFAGAANGELWRLDAETGAIQWHNKLEGMGWGHITLALQRGDAYAIATSAVAAAAAAEAAQRHAAR